VSGRSILRSASGRFEEIPIDEERDTATLALGLVNTAGALRAFFSLEPRGQWGAELVDPARRRTLFGEIALAGELLERILTLAEDIASTASSGEDLRRVHSEIRALLIRADKDVEQATTTRSSNRRDRERRRPRRGAVSV
jgi:hypothetical protein